MSAENKFIILVQIVCVVVCVCVRGEGDTKSYFCKNCVLIERQWLPKLWFVGYLKQSLEISKQQKCWPPVTSFSFYGYFSFRLYKFLA